MRVINILIFRVVWEVFFQKHPPWKKSFAVAPFLHNWPYCLLFSTLYNKACRQHAESHAAGACSIMKTMVFFMLGVDDNAVDHTVCIADTAVLPVDRQYY